MLVRPMIAPTLICMSSLIIGGTLILLRPIVSRSSMNDMIVIITPIPSMIRRRFSSRGEKSAKRNTRGLIIRSVNMRDIHAPYGAGDRHFSLL